MFGLTWDHAQAQTRCFLTGMHMVERDGNAIVKPRILMLTHDAGWVVHFFQFMDQTLVCLLR